MEMKKKTILLNFMPKSDDDDFTCRDGEVESYVAIPWLSEAEEKKRDESTEKVTEILLGLASTGITLPASAELLAVHSPVSASDGAKYYIYRLASGVLGFISSVSGSQSVTIGSMPRSLGTLYRTLPYGDMVTLICKSGIGWLVFDSFENSYQLLDSLPGAPEIIFEYDDAYLEGYTRMAGTDPEIEVNVDLHDLTDLIDSTAIADWLDNGHGLRVDEAVKCRVYESVAKATALCIEDVALAGMVLSPCGCVGAFSGALPTAVEVLGNGYSEASAKLLTWHLESTSLTLKVAFSLRPKQLSATFQLSALQKKWRPIFNSLSVYMSDSPRWWIPYPDDKLGLPVVTGYTSLGQTAGSGFAFRFRSRSKASLVSEVRDILKFRESSRVDISGVSSGTVLLAPPGKDRATYVPDYTDFLPVVPAGGCLTDEGVLLWSGRQLLTPMRENGVVYRYRDRICDSDIKGIIQGAGRKGTSAEGRHPLFVFCADGVRITEADGHGGYLNTRLISKVTVDMTVNPFAAMAPSYNRMTGFTSGVLFLSSYGLEHLSSSGTLKSLAAYPEGLDAGEVTKLFYCHEVRSVLLIMEDASVVAYDLEEERWRADIALPEGYVQHIIEDDSRLLLATDAASFSESSLVTATASLAELTVVRKVKEEAEAGGPQMIVGRPGLLTRPLKFGMPFTRKRIVAIGGAAPADFTIEGSNNLKDWTVVSTGTLPRSGLHPCGHFFHRIRLIADSPHIPRLRTLSLTLLHS